jgi:hypothetical protein
MGLIQIYCADGSDQFVSICIESLINREISIKDIEVAVAFGERPLSTVSRIYIAMLRAEKSSLPRSENILSILSRSPASDKALLLALVREFMASEAVRPAEQGSLVATIIQDEELTKRYGELIAPLVHQLLTPASCLADRAMLPYLPVFANFISLKLAEGGEVEGWRETGQRLITFFLEASGDRPIDEPFADQLLDVALSCVDDGLIEKVVVKTAKSFTWPFKIVYRLLEEEKTSAAYAMMDHGTVDNFFPFYLTTQVPAELVTIAEVSVAREPDQRNTFISMLCIKSILQNKHDESQGKRAFELLETITSRWGEIDHPSESYLQQGNRVLWREQAGDLEPAVPALRLWAEQNSIKSLLNAESSALKRSDAKREVWQRCLNSGYFGKEVAWIADLLIATGIRGDAKAHRSMNDLLARTISFNSFSKGCPVPLSSYYVSIRTWLMIHANPSLQLQPSRWQGMREELTGLGLLPEETASMMIDVLSGFSDVNQNRSLSSIHQTALYAELAKQSDPVLEARLIAHRWRIKFWSVAKGEPEAVVREIDAMLGGNQHREVWASFLFSAASTRLSTPGLRPLSDKEESKAVATWGEDFRQAATGTWLEGLANRYLESPKRAYDLILYPLGSPEMLQQLDQLPLGLRHKIATHERLDKWFETNPEHLQTALPICVNSICEAIIKTPEDATSNSLARYYRIGRLSQIILPDYQKNTAIYRPLYASLKKAADTANARHENNNSSRIDSALNPLRSLLL